MFHRFLSPVSVMLPVTVFASGLVQLSLVFLAWLSVSLHTSFVCDLMWCATRSHFHGGSVEARTAFQLQSLLFFFYSLLQIAFGDNSPLPCFVRSCRIFNFTLGEIPISTQVMWWKWWLSLFNRGVLINSWSALLDASTLVSSFDSLSPSG